MLSFKEEVEFFMDRFQSAIRQAIVIFGYCSQTFVENIKRLMRQPLL